MASAIPKTDPVTPASSAASQRALGWASAVLSAVILVFAIYTAVWTARMVHGTYSPVPYFDQWEIVHSMTQLGKTPVWSLLWAQHNEHRIPVGRLAGFADLRWFGGRNISLLIEVYLIQLCAALLFVWVFRRFGRPRPVVLATASGVFIFCMLCPVQLGNFIWGFQTTFVLAGFAAALSFAAAVCHADKLTEEPKRWISTPLALSWACAFLAECGLADGVLVWPLLLLLGFWLRFSKRTQMLTAGVGVAAVSLYLKGYYAPPQHANPWDSIRHPLAIAKFVITYFASTWDSALPSSSAWPTVSESVTAVAILFALASVIWLFFLRRSERNLLRTFLIANLLFAMAAAGLTSLGRLNFGLEQAVSNHYQAIALVFWAGLIALILTWVNDRAPSFALVEVQAGMVILMLATAGRFAGLERASKQHQIDLARAYIELAYNPTDHEGTKVLYPAVDSLPIWYAYLRSHHWGPDPNEFGLMPLAPAHPVKILAEPVPNWAGYRVVSSNKCLGYLDAVHPIAPGSDTVFAGGWAWDLEAGKPPGKIVLALPDGLVVGFGDVDGPRPDVQALKPEVKDVKTGWGTEAVVPHGSIVRAFAILSDSKSICPLANTIAAP